MVFKWIECVFCHRGVTIQANLCVFCQFQQELRDHLFSTWVLTKKVQMLVLDQIGVSVVIGDWGSEATWLLQQRGNTLDVVLWKLFWKRYPYGLWREQNGWLFQEWFCTIMDLARLIVHTVKLKAWTLLCPKYGTLLHAGHHILL